MVTWFEPRTGSVPPPTNVVDMAFSGTAFVPVAWIKVPTCRESERESAKRGDLVSITDCGNWPQSGSAAGRFARAEYTVVVDELRCDVAMEVGDPAAMPEVRAWEATSAWVVAYLLSDCGAV